MTVVLSMRCQNGLVVAADSPITAGSSNVSFPAQKLHHLGDQAALGRQRRPSAGCSGGRT
jgi:proteasome beta subunit